MLHTQNGDGGAQADVKSHAQAKTIPSTQEGEEAHKEMEDGKSAASGKCIRVGSERYTTHMSRSCFA